MSNRRKKSDPNKEEMNLYEDDMKLQDMKNEKSSQKASSSEVNSSKKKNSGKAEEKIVKKPMEIITPSLKGDDDDGETKKVNSNIAKYSRITKAQYEDLLKASYTIGRKKKNEPTITKERSPSPDLSATEDKTLTSDKSPSSSFKNKKSENTWETSTDYMNINVWNCKSSENDVPLKGRKLDPPPPPPVYDIIDGEIVIPPDALAKQIERLTVASNYHRRIMMKPNAHEIKWDAPIKIVTKD